MEMVKVEIPAERQKLFATLKEKYDPEGSKLRNYQLHLVETLKEFDAFCREHRIAYYMAFGTLLGAVRHKGFIPWDDDADLWMDRENYTKLEKLMQGEHHQLTQNIYVTTKGIRPELWSPPYAFIDIFVLDASPDNVFLRTIKDLAVGFLYIMVKCRGRIDARKFVEFKPYFVFAPLAYIHRMKTWKEKYKRAQKWFPKKGKNVQVYNDCIQGIKRKFPAGADIWTPVQMDFEGVPLMAPQGWDTILKIRYGDYMTLPNENEVHTHGIVNQFSNE